MDVYEDSRLETAAMAAIVGVGIAVRLGFLFRSMQLDEAYTYNEYAAKPVLDGLSWYTLPNNHLLNTLLVHAATALFGNERWAVRLPAFAAGVLLIPATFAMVSRLRGPSAALLAAALVAASEPLVDYSTNARGYTLVCLFTVLLASQAWRIMADGGGAWDWARFTVLPALGFFAIPIMLYPYVGIVLWLVIASRWPGPEGRKFTPVRLDRLIASGVFAAILIVVPYLPALIRTGLARVVANPYVSPMPFDQVLRGLPRSLVLAWLQWNRDVPRLLAVLFVLAWATTLVGLLTGRRRRACGAPSGLFLTVIGASVSVALVQRVVPYDRVWLFALPMYAGCVAEGLSRAIARLPGLVPDAGVEDQTGRATKRHAVLAVLLCAGLASLVARGESLGPKTWLTLHHADAMARLLKPILRPVDGVVALSPCDAPLKYEFLRQGVPAEHLYDYRIARACRLYVAVNGPADAEDVAEVLARFQVPVYRFSTPRLVRDFGGSALYALDLR
jgi:hypothetical protein